MSWTNREDAVWNEIVEWESAQFEREGTDFSLTYQKWLNKSIEMLDSKWKKNMLTTLDSILFHLHATVQQGRFDQQATDFLLTQARVFRDDINTVEDMKKLSIDQLRFIAKKQLAKQRLTSFAQGGITGVGGIMFTLSDLPLMLAINLRTIQLTALTYGYDLRKPYEMMLVLKLFHAISLPSHLRKEAWEQLFFELGSTDDSFMFYEGEEDIMSEAWMQQPLNNVAKLIFLSFARKKVIQGIPVLGIAFGASVNYQFTRRVSEAAHMFYQKRALLERREED
ncbi:EcsC family protein [Bacillus shivajii]|uniref:EcsC family protein n=1 Tax=Bacillus shivajii TaxID=1983719 RepID=UPI001CF9E033|nr:EcsC family protein [Bacillus shivajii]UCZ52278.1 EcsC family protein [Bacillus shivajii]